MTTSQDFNTIPADERRKAYALARAAKPFVGPTNAAFDAMTPEQKRVAIARDVLEWLRIGKIVPEPGTYLTVHNTAGQRVDIGMDPGPINGHKCTACALGAIFACATERTDLTIGGVNRAGNWPDAARAQLGPYFDLDQLKLIESAFEDYGGFYLDGTPRGREDHQMAYRAVRFGVKVGDAHPCFEGRYVDRSMRRQRSPDRILRAIMQNIIDNNGTFIP